ncbi:NAD(P)-dependent dehydrogenase (short-subunit alcohol dehydrogenase family) [Paenibacillus taihuensis]|uniref:NAD(P)-dependent dehydrogenase (Short-subunit alcohol dehydrogenase family) n=1 Tax=Paenibacillus taihuensis TaxID=1156355 RepID=A0A3D9Q3C5_9BACL|nr:SDR family NAD(P)-dependent oxidoreductase [Paenibacillus taihuensis]REE56276.1 NAD(P)-dependent dehydrogenase (short-subunit alcohol dehydrogenase family) [Paenibacillus taihuensis]
MSSWKDKVVIVTGGGSGIGRAVCQRFAKEGATVIIVDRDAEQAGAAAAEIDTAGFRAAAIMADVALESDVKQVVAETLSRFGHIDVLVNNAAVCPQIRITEMSLQGWNEVITNNLTSVFLFSREVIPSMVQQGGGAIVNVSSVHALATLDGYSAYAASKGGIVSLTRAIALDFAKQNIRVNTVLPGAIHTPMLESSVKNLDTPREETMKTWNEAQPIGRVGQAEEIASVVLFAASPDNSFMTGASLVVDGGMTIDL